MSDLPEVIGNYKIVSEIARGGMGIVYKAIHPSLKRHVIIKKLSIRGNNSIKERFKREAQIFHWLSSCIFQKKQADVQQNKIHHLFPNMMITYFLQYREPSRRFLSKLSRKSLQALMLHLEFLLEKTLGLALHGNINSFSREQKLAKAFQNGHKKQQLAQNNCFS